MVDQFLAIASLPFPGSTYSMCIDNNIIHVPPFNTHAATRRAVQTTLWVQQYLTTHQYTPRKHSESNQTHFQLAILNTALHMHNTLFQPKNYGNNTRC